MKLTHLILGRVGAAALRPNDWQHIQSLDLWEFFSLFPACAALTVIQKETSSSEEGIVVGGCVIFSVSSEEMPVCGTKGLAVALAKLLGIPMDLLAMSRFTHR